MDVICTFYFALFESNSQVLAEKKWKEVTTSFSFPPSATNASFILRKYYLSLLHHYEQVYYFEVHAWIPVSTGVQNLLTCQLFNFWAFINYWFSFILFDLSDAWQKTAPISTHAVDDPVQPSAEIQVAPLRQQRLPEAESTTPAKRQRINVSESLPGGSFLSPL